MKLRDGFGLERKGAPPPRDPIASAGPRRTGTDRGLHELKVRVHRELLDRLELNSLARMDPEQANAQLRVLAGGLLDEQGVALAARERDQLIDEVLHEVYGLGPIEPLLRDPEVADILVNGPRQVYVERAGRLELTPIVFRDEAHLMQIIDRIVSRMDRRIDESSPMVDARLPDGSRVNAIIPPLAIDGPVLSIRRFGQAPLSMQNLIEKGSLTPPMAGLLRAMVRARLNILISGGTGSGKTTLLNCLTAYVPDAERIVTIEDSAELKLQQPHVVRLETRPPNIEGRGEVTQRDLVRNALRMRPDRIIVGEVRGPEALDMLQAMNTGHDGSISTIHANSARDSFSRLEVMMQMAGLALGTRAMRQQISQAIDVVVQTARLADGSRKVVAISEVTGMEGETITLQELFIYERGGVDAEGRIMGSHVSTGIRPRFVDRLKASGHEVDAAALAYLGRG
jgi:pilus assembly protein CpaF